MGAALGVRIFFVTNADQQPFEAHLGDTVVLEGVVSDDPDVRTNTVRVTISTTEVDGDAVSGKIVAVLPAHTQVEYGDTLRVRGKLEAPESFETPAGRSFDYPGYLRARGVTALMQRATLQELQGGQWGVMRTLFAIKHTFEHGLERVMSGPAAALMEGLLLGEKHGLSAELTQAFVLVGLIHVVVLSGYNIGVVSEWVLRLCNAILPRRLALGATATVIVLFALMAGGGMATIRAMLMGLIAILARFLRRPTAALRALGFATLAMLLWNPLVVFDVGFVLSVLATFGLITLAPAMERKLTWLPRGDIRSTAATTLSVQLFVLPALLYYTGVLSLVALPINVLVLPLIPLAMLLGFAAGMLALVHPYLALVPALAAQLLLDAMLWLVQWAASLPFAAATVSSFPAWVAAVVYMPLTALAIYAYGRVKRTSSGNKSTATAGDIRNF